MIQLDLTPYSPSPETQAKAFALALAAGIKDIKQYPGLAVERAEKSGLLDMVSDLPMALVTTTCVRCEEILTLLKSEGIIELVAQDGECFIVLWLSKHLFRRGDAASESSRAHCLMKAALSYPQVINSMGVQQFPGGLALRLNSDKLMPAHVTRMKKRQNEALLAWLNVFYNRDARLEFEESLYPGNSIFAHWVFPNHLASHGMVTIDQATPTRFVVRPNNNLTAGDTFEIPRGDQPDWCFNRSFWPFEPNAYL